MHVSRWASLLPPSLSVPVLGEVYNPRIRVESLLVSPVSKAGSFLNAWLLTLTLSAMRDYFHLKSNEDQNVHEGHAVWIVLLCPVGLVLWIIKLKSWLLLLVSAVTLVQPLEGIHTNLQARMQTSRNSRPLRRSVQGAPDAHAPGSASEPGLHIKAGLKGDKNVGTSVFPYSRKP